MSEFSRRGAILRMVGSALLAAVAGAGLVASTSSDLKELTAFHIADFWLLPGLIAIGVLISIANDDDVARSAIALLGAGILGATLAGLAIAAPGFRVERVQTDMIDRGTIFGLLALLLIVLFGLAGIIVAWIAGAFFKPGRM